jgi:hypothetical protein
MAILHQRCSDLLQRNNPVAALRASRFDQIFPGNVMIVTESRYGLPASATSLLIGGSIGNLGNIGVVSDGQASGR